VAFEELDALLHTLHLPLGRRHVVVARRLFPLRPQRLLQRLLQLA
jgi:hypothetical protein